MRVNINEEYKKQTFKEAEGLSHQKRMGKEEPADFKQEPLLRLTTMYSKYRIQIVQYC